MKTNTVRFQSHYPRISLLLAWTWMAASAVAIEPQAVDRLKRGCLFAYLPDENAFIPTTRIRSPRVMAHSTWCFPALMERG